MNRDRIESNWKQIYGKTKQKRGKSAEDDFDVVAGQHGQRNGKIRQRNGVGRDELDKEISDWQDRLVDSWFK